MGYACGPSGFPPPPPPASGQLPSSTFTSDLSALDRSAAAVPGPAPFLGLDVYLKRATSLGHATSPGFVGPSETASPLRLSPGTMWPLSALSGHIELSSSATAVMSYTASEGTATPWARSLTLFSRWPPIGRRYFHSWLFPGRTWLHIWRPLPYRHSRLNPSLMQWRLHGLGSEAESMSPSRFRSAPASSHFDDTTELVQQVAQLMGVGHAEGASSDLP